MRCQTLFKKDDHIWLVFWMNADIVSDHMRLNGHVICAGSSVTLIDPGSIKMFPTYLAAFSQQISLENVTRIIITSLEATASSSLSMWLQVLPDNVEILVPDDARGRLALLDNNIKVKTLSRNGEKLTLEDGSILTFIPANHLNGPIAVSVYDSYSRVLYSGAVGFNLADENQDSDLFLTNWNKTLPSIIDFHDLWVPDHTIRSKWVSLVKQNEIDFLAPLIGACMRRDQMRDFFDILIASHPKLSGLPSQETKKMTNLLSKTMPSAEKNTPLADPNRPRSAQDFAGKKYRLITRSDFDGLVCAAILEELNLIKDILFVHPSQMQLGEIEVSENDISTNLPYSPEVFAVFDHHLSEINRVGGLQKNHIIDPASLSAARVVYNFFGGKKILSKISTEMLDAVDQADSAKYTIEDILHPTKWALLNFIMDPRTGLGRFQGFRIPNYELMMSLIDLCREKSIEKILEEPDVQERVTFYREQESLFQKQIKRCAQVYDNVVVIDLKNEPIIHAGNRFIVYALYPECNISLHVMWGLAQQKTVFACGKSIFNRTSKSNVGELMLNFGGGGHAAVGSCYVENSIAGEVQNTLIKRMKSET